LIASRNILLGWKLVVSTSPLLYRFFSQYCYRLPFWWFLSEPLARLFPTFFFWVHWFCFHIYLNVRTFVTVFSQQSYFIVLDCLSILLTDLCNGRLLSLPFDNDLLIFLVLWYFAILLLESGFLFMGGCLSWFWFPFFFMTLVIDSKMQLSFCPYSVVAFRRS
jgi:hypothetical protein